MIRRSIPDHVLYISYIGMHTLLPRQTYLLCFVLRKYAGWCENQPSIQTTTEKSRFGVVSLGQSPEIAFITPPVLSGKL